MCLPPSLAAERLLVTGGNGCVGSHVCLRAMELGLPVVALVREPEPAQWLAEQGVELVVADLARGDLLPRAIARADPTVVVHCAALPGQASFADCEALHVAGLRHLLHTLEQHRPPRRFIHLSSLWVHRPGDHHGTDESAPLTERGLPAGPRSLVAAERILNTWRPEGNSRATILRPGLLYGPRERWVLPRLLVRLQEERFRYFGSGEQLLCNTYVGNLVEAVFAALAVPASAGRTYHVTDAEPVTQRDFISMLAQLAGWPTPRAALPLRWARLAARLPGWLRPNDEENETAAELRLFGSNRQFSIDKAIRELNYRPRVSFREGIRMSLDQVERRSPGIESTAQPERPPVNPTPPE